MCSARVSEFFKFPTLSFSPSPLWAMPEHLGCRGFLLLGNDVLNDGLRHGTMWCWVDSVGIGTWWKVGGNHISWDLFFRWCFTFLPVLKSTCFPHHFGEYVLLLSKHRTSKSTYLIYGKPFIEVSTKGFEQSELPSRVFWNAEEKCNALRHVKKSMAFFGAVGSEFPFASMDFREKGSSIWWDCLFFSNFRLMKYVSARQMLFLSFIFHMMNDTCSGYDSKKIGPSK